MFIIVCINIIHSTIEIKDMIKVQVNTKYIRIPTVKAVFL